MHFQSLVRYSNSSCQVWAKQELGGGNSVQFSHVVSGAQLPGPWPVPPRGCISGELGQEPCAEPGCSDRGCGYLNFQINLSSPVKVFDPNVACED